MLSGMGCRPLGAELQNRLAASFHKTRDPRLERELVEANLRLVVRIARDNDHSRGRQLEDLVQEGCLGLVEAVRRFDPTKGAQFSTYAGFWIRAFVIRYNMNNVRVVRAVRTRADRVAFFQGVVGGSEVSFETATNPMGWPLRDILAEPAASAEELVETAERVHQVRKGMADLEPRLNGRDATILRERLLTPEPKPLRDIARRLSLSGERIRQIEGTLVAAIRAEIDEQRGFVPAAAA